MLAIRRIWVAIALVLVGGTLAARAAKASSGIIVVTSGPGGGWESATSASFGVGGSNGYSVSVYTEGQRVTLSAQRGYENATYTAKGRVSPTGISARFGSRGRIDVRFRQTDGFHRQRPPRRCKGRPRITRFGVFAGVIRFRGERGYTQVREDAAKGNVLIWRRWKCKPRKRHRSPHSPQRETEPEKNTSLEAWAPKRHISFSASTTHSEGFSWTSFWVFQTQRRPGMQVAKFAYANGREGPFRSIPIWPPRP